VSAVQNGFLLDMTVDDTDPNRAQSIAQTWADEFIQEHEADMAPLEPTERVTIKELDKPLPGVLYFPKTKQYVLAAGILGLVIGAVLAFLLEYLDDTLKTPDDVERFVSLPLIGSIPMASEVTLPPAKSNGRAKVKLAGGRTSG
jgi:capsular polysaccharide biosynthesis protein